MIRSIIKLAKYYRYAGNIKNLNNIFQEEYFENNGYRNYNDVPENKKFELNEYIKSRSREVEEKLKKDLKNNTQYISWFYDIIKNKDQKIDEDYDKIINTILEFNKIKNSLNLSKEEKNIQNYKTFFDLHKFIYEFKNKNKQYNKVDFPLIYSNNKYNLYKIAEENKEKFQDLYGEDGFKTAWCVTDKYQSYFDFYLNGNTDYYILWLTKNNKPFALFHNGSNQFKDIHDNPLKDDSNEVLDGLAKGCKPTNFENDLEYYKIPLIKYQNPNIRDNELFVKLYPNAKLNSDGSIDVNGYVYIDKEFVKDGKLTIKFNKVNGSFNCDRLELVSLEGCPEYIENSFDCSDNQLKNLEGCPKYVGWDFNCSGNDLFNLKGCPKYIEGNFNCSYNQLTSLDYFPEEVKGEISLNGNNFPVELYSKIFCLENKNAKLNSDMTINIDEYISPYILKPFVKDGKLLIKFNKVNGGFDCNGLKLISLDGCPKYVGGDFYCFHNNLTSLDGCPEYVGRDFNCSVNNLINLKGCPEYVRGDFDCSYNNLTSLEHCPKYIKGSFNCSYNKLANLDYTPQKCDILYIKKNPIKITNEIRNKVNYIIIDK